MCKIEKKFWEIFEKIIRHLENFTFTLSLLLFIIVPVDRSRLARFFSKKKITYVHSVSKENKFKNPQPTLRNVWRCKFPPSIGQVLQIVNKYRSIPYRYFPITKNLPNNSTPEMRTSGLKNSFSGRKRIRMGSSLKDKK